MASAYNRLQRANQRAFKICSKRLGVTILFKHRKNDWVSLYAETGSEDGEPDESGGKVDQDRVTYFDISTLQAGFETPSGEVDPVTVGDEIVYLTRSYPVSHWKANTVKGVYRVYVDGVGRVRTGV